MKATELMVGDWVMPLKKKLKGIPGKVTTIDGGTGVCWIDSEDYSYLVPCSDVERIPLTPEILEKNGLTLSFNGNFFPEDKHYVLEISVEDGYIFWTINGHEYGLMPLRYVHELQHALNLCGIEKEIEL